MIVCLTGMHRSGTSLMASYLIRCGITMGETLAKPGPGNKKGHFEDRAFLDLQKQWLKYNHCHMYNPNKTLQVPSEGLAMAKHLVEMRKDTYPHWGWKDPRTSLFLDFWHDIIPETKYVFMYREPYLVMDSLFRRKGEYHLYMMPWRAMNAWLVYNQKVLEFLRQYPDQCTLVNIGGFNRDPETSRVRLSKWLQYSLECPYSDVYEKKAISTGVTALTKFYMTMLEPIYGKKISKLYRELEENALVPLGSKKEGNL